MIAGKRSLPSAAWYPEPGKPGGEAESKDY